MKDTLARLLDNPKAVKIITAAVAWLLTWLVAKFGFDNGKDWSAQIATFSATVAVWGVSELRAHLVKQSVAVERANVATIQKLLPQVLPENGRCDDATVAAVAQVVQAAQPPLDDAYPPLPPGRPQGVES